MTHATAAREALGVDWRVQRPCGLCGDPDRPPTEWHSEDYSRPSSFLPPQTYPLCKSCHGRLHKRFNRPPAEWELFCRHVEAGGYAREFTVLYSQSKRADLSDAISRGELPEIVQLRPRAVADCWWRGLSIDPESLEAAWARPRPLRPRPEANEYRDAIGATALTTTEWAILRAHSVAPRRTMTMRAIAEQVLGLKRPQAANLAYGSLAKRIGSRLNWEPDRRADGTAIWMSVIAEGWRPTSKPGMVREYELVMVPVLRDVIASWDQIAQAA